MRFQAINDSKERTRAIVYVNRHCPSFDPCPDDLIVEWVQKNKSLNIYEIKEGETCLGYVTFNIQGENLHVETIFIHKEFRAAKDYLKAANEFALNVAKENKLKTISCEAIHPSLAKLYVEKFGFSLTYKFSKNVN